MFPSLFHFFLIKLAAKALPWSVFILQEHHQNPPFPPGCWRSSVWLWMVEDGPSKGTPEVLQRGGAVQNHTKNGQIKASPLQGHGGKSRLASLPVKSHRALKSLVGEKRLVAPEHRVTVSEWRSSLFPPVPQRLGEVSYIMAHLFQSRRVPAEHQTVPRPQAKKLVDLIHFFSLYFSF